MVQGQEPIPRKVVEHGMYVRHCKVEVYLMELKLCQKSEQDKVVVKHFSKGDSLGEFNINNRLEFQQISTVLQLIPAHALSLCECKNCTNHRMTVEY